MIVYRLSHTEYCHDLSGKGASIYGGRWNSKGKALLYTSDSRALCITEVAVHIPLGIVPVDYSLGVIEIPDASMIQAIELDQLPSDWKSFPHSASTQTIGDEFIRGNKMLILKVPSAVVPGEFNYLINPAHPEFPTISLLRCEPFIFDERLFK
jgi:RES domain-containing protein